MDYKAVSQQVVDNVGGLENIEGATHCVTRLRLVLKDTSKYNKAELENIDGVKGVLYNSGQLMIIFGTGTVNKVYDEFMALTGAKEISASEVKGAEADKKGKFFSVLKVFSDIFIPIIPAFVGAAIIIGLKSLIVANGLFGMEGSLARPQRVPQEPRKLLCHYRHHVRLPACPGYVQRGQAFWR